MKYHSKLAPLFKKKLLSSLCTALILGLASPITVAQDSSNIEQTQTFELNIPAQSLGSALNALSVASRTQIAGSTRIINGQTSQEVKGSYTVNAALSLMLEGTGLVMSQTGDSSYAVTVSTNTREAQLPVEEMVVIGSYTSKRANSATGLDMSLRETPQAITVMTHFRMEDQNLTEISDAISQSVGLSYDGSPLGSDGSYFYARGLNVTNFQIDGVPRPAGIYGFQVTTADMIAYDRIEIVRGATGLMNGVGSPAASINLIRKRPTEEFGGYLSAQIDSWGKYRFALDVGGALNESGSIRGRVAAAKEQGESYLDRAELDKEAFYAMLEADLADQTLFTTGIEYQSIENTSASRGGTPLFFSDGSRTNFDRSANFGAKWNILSNNSISVFANLQHTFNNGWKATLDVEHTEPEYNDAFGYLWGYFDKDTGEATGFGAARWASDLKQDFIGLTLTGAFNWLGREHDLVFALSHSTSDDDGLNYCGWWCGGDYYPDDIDGYALLNSGSVTQPDFSPTGGSYGGTITQNSVYSALRLRPLEPLALIIGARLTDWSEEEWDKSDSGTVTYTPVNKEKNVITPYVGLVLDITENLSAYASFTQIFEPQNRYDVNDNRLDPLEGNNYEIGIKADVLAGLLSVTADVFRIEQDNFAVYTGEVTPSGNNVYRTEDGTPSTGFEVEVAGEILPGWQVVGGFSRAEPKDNEGQPLLTDVASDSIKVFSSYEMDRLTLGANLRWQNDVYTVEDGPNYDQSYTQGSFVVMDLMVKYAASEAIILQLNADNIFDKKYYSGFYGGIYGEPRSIAASVKYNF